MRWAIAITLFAVAAHADQSAPELRGKGAQDRCAARFERARDEFVKQQSEYKDAKVEAVAREFSEPGDPTAHSTVDVVELRFRGNVLALVQLGRAKTGWVYPEESARFREIFQVAVDDCLKMKTPQ
jgi:hypothetical protein